MVSNNSVQVEALGGRSTRRLLRPGQRWIIGADLGCDLHVRDSAVSPRHCALRHLGGEVELQEVDERAEIRVGGAAVARALLPLDGIFEIGDTTVTLRQVSAMGGEPLPGMVGTGKSMQRLACLVRRASRLDIPLLIRGESGTGKELVARAIHALSGRAEGPFVAINGATLSDSLGASALFGHARGAFTGAAAMRKGAFREADRGTLFIDEVSSLTPTMQAALLRVLEEQQVIPVGEDRPLRVDVRTVAATCEPLETMTRRRTFRLDLYQRLSACVLRVPPLRERPEDLPALTDHLLGSARLDVRLTTSARAVLRSYAFPGNVRELQNILTQAALSRDGVVIGGNDIQAAIDERMPRRRKSSLTPSAAAELLERSGGNVSEAARRAGVPRSTFRDKLRRARQSAVSQQ